MPKCSSSPHSPPPPGHPLYIIIKDMHALVTTYYRTVKMLQFYITTSFCVDTDHFNAKCRKLYMHIYCFCSCCFLHFANATCRNVCFSLHFYILRCNITYCEKTSFQTTPFFEIVMKIIYPFPAFFVDSDTWMGLPLGVAGYRESLWNVLLMCRRFQQSKVHLVIKCRCIWDNL